MELMAPTLKEMEFSMVILRDVLKVPAILLRNETMDVFVFIICANKCRFLCEV